MSIIRISFGFSTLNAAGVADMASEITEKMGANAILYPAPNPSLIDVNTAIGILRTSITNAANKDRLMIEIRDEKRQIVESLLILLGSYSVSAVSGDKIALETGGWKVIERGPGLPLVPPGNVRISYIQGVSGSLKLDWDRVPGASYLVQFTDQNPALPTTSWHFAGSCTKSKLVISEGLNPGTTYWFRIFSVKGDSVSGATAPICIMAV